jgi:hypothetical protein
MKHKTKVRKKKTGPPLAIDKSAVIIDGSALRPTLKNVALVYNVSTQKILGLLTQRGFDDNIKPHQTLDRKQLHWVDLEFQTYRLEHEKAKGKYRVKWFDEPILPSQNSTEKVEEFKRLVFNTGANLFDKVKLKIEFKKNNVISSHFLDHEAANLCSKMASAYARKVARRFSEGKKWRDEARYIIHYIANKALREYGGEMLSFIYRLRNLEFKNQTARSMLSYKNVNTEFPSLTFMYGQEELTLSFYERRINDSTITRPWLWSKRQSIGFVDRQGIVNFDPLVGKLKNFRPLLELFVEKTKLGEYKITSGVETGKCSICGRDLKDPVSLRIGIGPVCREQS